ncbi:hypothetical protein BWI17_18060 [Betaproteobacteria bacterium GR16-43]|nr:hypothetical protein BWI17_18060 [Betaproteobacteria bacterium GR16-43]
MTAIAAVPAQANPGPDFAAFALPVSSDRFSDALMALLAPESAPTLSAADATMLGGLALDGKGKVAKPFELDTDSVKAAAGEAAAADAMLFAALPAPIVPVATPEAFVAEGGMTTSTGKIGTLGLGEALGALAERPDVQLREKLDPRSEARPEFLLETHFPGAHTHVAPAHEAKEAPTFNIEAPIGSSQFREQAADSIRWMARNGETHAEINIHPAELGPIQIEMKMVGDRADLIFVAAHPDTRDALQDQLPQLFDLLAESGIQLGQAHVRDESPDAQGFAARAGLASETENGAETAPKAALLPRGASGDRLVDTFA